MMGDISAVLIAQGFDVAPPSRDSIEVPAREVSTSPIGRGEARIAEPDGAPASPSARAVACRWQRVYTQPPNANGPV